MTFEEWLGRYYPWLNRTGLNEIDTAKKRMAGVAWDACREDCALIAEKLINDDKLFASVGHYRPLLAHAIASRIHSGDATGSG